MRLGPAVDRPHVPDPASLAEELLNEQAGERDIALYVAAPQQILGIDPQQLFLDPSDTLRLWFI